MRLIDADEAIINFGFEWDDIPPTREEFVRFLKKQPTVDAVPVVRCRECKYFKVWGDGCKTCSFWTDQHDMPTDEEAFCSNGEWKEGADHG